MSEELIKKLYKASVIYNSGKERCEVEAEVATDPKDRELLLKRAELYEKAYDMTVEDIAILKQADEIAKDYKLL